MKPGILLGFVWLLVCWLVGEALANLLHLPLPGTVAGMLLLLAFSLCRRGINHQTHEAGNALLSHMALLFVPAGVGLIDQATIITNQGIAMLATLVLSVFITMGVTALTLKFLLTRKVKS